MAYNIRLINSNLGFLKTNPEREMGREIVIPEAANPVMRSIKRELNLGCRVNLKMIAQIAPKFW